MRLLRFVVCGLMVCGFPFGAGFGGSWADDSVDPGEAVESPAVSAPSEVPRGDGPRVRVVQGGGLLPSIFAPVPRRFRPATGFVAYVDSEGNLAVPPAGSMPVPVAQRSPQPQPAYPFDGRSAAGGVGMEGSHIRSYVYVRVGPNGALEEGCVQGTPEVLQARLEQLKESGDAGNDVGASEPETESK